MANLNHTRKRGKQIEEGIKQVFRKHVREIDKYINVETEEAEKAKREVDTITLGQAMAASKLIEVYSDICGISYDAAARELHEGLEEKE